MASRDYLKHVVSTSETVGSALGDEYYNPISNKLFKRLAVNGISVAWVEQQLGIAFQSSGVTAATAPRFVNFPGATLLFNAQTGVLDVQSGGIPGGANTQVQYNNAGAFAGSSNFTWNNSTQTLAITGFVTTFALSRSGNINAPSWTTTSPIFNSAAAVLTDVSGLGPIALRVGHSMLSPNFASTNVTTITNAANLYVNANVASTNTTITNNWSIYNEGNMRVTGTLFNDVQITAAGTLIRSGNFSRNTWTVGGAVELSVTTITDTNGSGTIATKGHLGIGQATLASTNVTTVTNAANLYVAGNVIAGTNTTLTNTWGIYNAGNQYVGGNLGVATQSPNSRLEVYQTLGSNATLGAMITINPDFGSATTTGFGGSIVWRGRTVGNLNQINAQISAYNENISDNGYALGFYTTPNAGTGITQRMTILRGGNVGIGTVSPSGKLHLFQNAGGANQLTLDTNFASGNAYAINPFITGISNGGFSIRDVTNSVERLVIQYSTGNVGIGTTAPATKLSVGSASHTSPADTNRILNWYSSSGGSELPNSVHSITAGNDSANTTQPQQVGLSLFNANATDNIWSPAITFGGRSTSGNFMNGAAAIAAKLPTNTNDNNFRGGDIHFFTQGTTTAGLTSKMVLSANGNVGIGTTAPSHALTIQGTLAAAGTVTVLTLRNSLDGGVGMNFTNSVSVPLASINAQVTSAGAGTDDGILAFSTAVNGVNTEKVRIESNGNMQMATGFILQSISTALTAAGTTQGNALLLVRQINDVTVVAAATGVRLPVAVAGVMIIVRNSGLNNLNVYPNTGAQIQSLGANVAMVLVPAAMLEYVAVSATQWYLMNSVFA